MSIREAFKKYYRIEIELLLAYLLKKPKEFLFLNPEKELLSFQVKKLSGYVRRRQLGEPMAYILGYKDFCGLRFRVNKNVLIPRPETEQLVESLKLKVKSLRQNRIKILDVGTGSGNIIISLGKSLWETRVEFYASDISKKALAVARQNAKQHRVKIEFIHSNLLKNITGNFDILVANLPYLSRVWGIKSGSLKFEPGLALFAKNKGLALISGLMEQIVHKKHKPKFIFLEFDPRQKPALNLAIKKYLPNAEIKFNKDFFGLWRNAEIRLNF